MKDRKIDIKRLLIVSSVIVLFLVGVATVRSCIRGSKIIKIDSPYVSNIKITATTDDEKKENYSIDVVNLEKISRVSTDFFDRNIYIEDEKIILDVGGKYSYYEKENNLRSLKSILKKIKLDEPVTEKNGIKTYDREIDAKMINEILDMVFINRTTDRNERAVIEGENDKIKSFSIFLIGIEGYKDLNLTMNFKDVEKKDEFDSPIFYKDIMKKTEDEIFAID